MADQLATPTDLASLLQRDDIDAYKAGVLIEIATSIVQEAAGGQRIVQVLNDTAALLSTSDSWLDLPQQPVTAVTTVVLDGVTLTLGTDYKVFGNRLWRRIGWQNNIGWTWQGIPWRPSYAPFGGPWVGQEPSQSTVTYSHGYAAGAQELQLGRGAVLSMCAGAYANPTGLKAESIDDYAATYGALGGQLEASPYLKAAIRRQYGRRGGLVRIG